jgi:hypothetical protein
VRQRFLKTSVITFAAVSVIIGFVAMLPWWSERSAKEEFQAENRERSVNDQ